MKKTMERTSFTFSRSVVSPANAIFIVDCLAESDAKSGRRRHEGILDELLAQDSASFDTQKEFVKHFRISSRQSFAEALGWISGYCNEGIRPLVFIDAHGDTKKGLTLPLREFLGWPELLELLRRITIAASGELTVIAACCESMGVMQHVDRNKRLPFSFYYGYSKRVATHVVEEETQKIYESLLRDGGRTWMDTHLTIECYSEYEHVSEPLSIALLISAAPNTSSALMPELSRKCLRRVFDQTAFNLGLPLSGGKKKLNKFLASGDLAVNVVKRFMHDTHRRQRYIDDIRKHMQR